jgi:hypothetical protein
MAWDIDYATLDVLKNYVKVPLDDTEDDVELALALTAASRAVDRACFRQFGKSDASEDRYFTAQWDRILCAWIIRIDDITDTAGLTVAYDSARDGTYGTSITPFRLLPRNAAAKQRPYEEIQILRTSSGTPSDADGAVRVHGTFGWSTVPATVTQATLLQASRFASRRDSPYGIAGSPDTGAELRLLAKVDVDVAVMLRPYRRIWGAV